MTSPLTFRRATPADQDAIEALLDAISDADGRPGLSEHKVLHLTGDDEARAVVAEDPETGAVAGYGQAAWHRPSVPDGTGRWSIEVALLPGRRASAEVDALLRRTIDEAGDGDRITAWAWDGPIAEALGRLGWVARRALHQMRRSLPLTHPAPLPAGVRLDRFRVGVDEAEWLAVNNAAFGGHPENGALTLHDLELKLAQEWFDPAGLLMARAGGRLLGSCWTKLHPGGIGEIYAIGVHPDARGRGLGMSLAVAGLDDVHRRRGAKTGMLYADEANQEGRRLYRRLGFRTMLVNREYEAG